LYYSLYNATGEEKWLDLIKLSANYMIEEGIDKHETEGFWNNAGVCCGTAGVAEYYLWLYDITSDMDYQEFSVRMTESLIASSARSDSNIKWIHAENRKSQDNVAAQTGLMQGSAGIGLWFLQLHARQQHKDPLIVLPDKPRVKY